MNLFELFVKIGVDDQASGKLSDLSSKLGNGLKTAAKIGTAAVGAAAAGITALTTAAVNNYAEYEQLVGGVDTLFKDASQKVQQYAADAYKTAGMSANDYMANATAFSASLISALGDDTEAAAEYANRAMVSMSDNANKMGTNIDSIVQTYQSLARGNFAMLDNLKLGYGGTKAELERLIADAASYTEIQKEMGITVDASSMSFDNIVNAIAVVQGHLGIAGATALEAGTTIEGSVNSMKAAWDNLITGIGDGDQDLDTLITNFTDSIVTVGENVIPRIVELAPRLVEATFSLLGIVVESIGSAAEEYGPQLLEYGAGFLTWLGNGVQQGIPTFVAMLPELILAFLNFVTENLPTFLEAGTNFVISLIKGVVDAIPVFVADLPKIIKAFVDFIAKNLPQIVRSGGEIVGNLVVGILQMLWSVQDSADDLVWALIDGLTSMTGSLIQAGAELVNGIWEGISGAWGDLVSWVGGLWNDLTSGFDFDFGFGGYTPGYNSSNAGGLNYVPFDGYIAQLHKGERVLTSKEAEAYRSKNAESVVNITVNMTGSADENTGKRIGQQIVKEMRYRGMVTVG